MARPLKKGLGYFPLDTDILSNRKIQRLNREYGCSGLCIYLASLCEIYKTNGYYIPYNGDFCFDIGFTLNTDEKQVDKIIRFCAGIKLFDSVLLETRGVLTSSGIQQRFLEICKRNTVRLDPELEIVSETGFPGAFPRPDREKGEPNPLPSVSNTSEEAAEAVSGDKTVRKRAEKVKPTGQTAVKSAETPVYASKTPLKGKGNKKENTTQHGNTPESQFTNDHGEASRRAELLRMAANATRSK